MEDVYVICLYSIEHVERSRGPQRRVQPYTYSIIHTTYSIIKAPYSILHKISSIFHKKSSIS